MQHKIIKTGDGTYEYRGISVERVDSQKGTAYYWITADKLPSEHGVRCQLNRATRKELIRDIDHALDGHGQATPQPCR